MAPRNIQDIKAKTDEQWTMDDGTKIWIADMTESHAKNCLRMILRRTREDREMTTPDDFEFTPTNWPRDDDWENEFWENELSHGRD